VTFYILFVLTSGFKVLNQVSLHRNTATKIDVIMEDADMTLQCVPLSGRGAHCSPNVVLGRSCEFPAVITLNSI
jgi:hypothetical protein